MGIAKRILVFFSVNLLIFVTMSITLSVLSAFGVIGPWYTQNGVAYASLAVVCLVWGMGGALISLALSRILAKWLYGVRVIEPGDAAELGWLVETVHKLARAANLPAMPQVGVYGSDEVNAFATGPTKGRALVAVSAGLLGSLNKEQIEAVLGHEISHVANGDMVTMVLLQGVINAIVMFLARVIAFFLVRGEGGRRANPWLRGLVTVLLEMVLSFLGLIVVAAFSRRREFRADEGGAGLAGRQNMINALDALRRTLDCADLTHNKSLATLKISSRPRFGLFASHPPLAERIERLKQAV